MISCVRGGKEATSVSLMLSATVRYSRKLLSKDKPLHSPYIEVTHDTCTYQTEIGGSTPDIFWDEQFLFLLGNNDENSHEVNIENGELRVELFDSSLSDKNRHLGSALVSLSTLLMNPSSALRPQDVWCKFHSTARASVSGEVLLTLQFHPTPLLKQGFLYKKSSGILTKFNRRLFYVVDGMLIYVKDGMPGGQTYLENCKVDGKLDLKGKYKYGFKVIADGEEKVYSAETEEERVSWVEALLGASKAKAIIPSPSKGGTPKSPTFKPPGSSTPTARPSSPLTLSKNSKNTPPPSQPQAPNIITMGATRSHSKTESYPASPGKDGNNLATTERSARRSFQGVIKNIKNRGAHSSTPPPKTNNNLEQLTMQYEKQVLKSGLSNVKTMTPPNSPTQVSPVTTPTNSLSSSPTTSTPYDTYAQWTNYNTQQLGQKLGLAAAVIDKSTGKSEKMRESFNGVNSDRSPKDKVKRSASDEALDQAAKKDKDKEKEKEREKEKEKEKPKGETEEITEEKEKDKERRERKSDAHKERDRDRERKSDAHKDRERDKERDKDKDKDKDKEKKKKRGHTRQPSRTSIATSTPVRAREEEERRRIQNRQKNRKSIAIKPPPSDVLPDALYSRVVSDLIARSPNMEPEENATKTPNGIPAPPPMPPTQPQAQSPVRQTAVMSERYFHGAGDRPGVLFWRIEKMLPVPFSHEHHKGFFIGDSYIILKTSKKPTGETQWDIHLWIGKDSPQDSSAAAAIWSKTLGDHLKSQGIHHREEQGSESPEFLDYFGGKLELLVGGVQSSFRHFEKAKYTPRLLQVFTREEEVIENPLTSSHSDIPNSPDLNHSSHNGVTTETPQKENNDNHLNNSNGTLPKLKTSLSTRCVEVSSKSLNRSDVFILDLGNTIFLWMGAMASRKKKAKALEIAAKLRVELSIGTASQVLDESDECDLFWNTLRGSPNEKLPDLPDPDSAFARIWLYKVYISPEGKVAVAPVEEEVRSNSILESDVCYVLDCENEVFLWHGKDAPLLERKSSVALANEILTMFERPPWSQVVVTQEGEETVLFREKFTVWKDRTPAAVPSSNNLSSSSNSLAPSREFKVSSLVLVKDLDDKNPLTKTPVIAPGGNLEVWASNSTGTYKIVPQDQIGEFYMYSSYVCLYTYTPQGKSSIKSVIYFWEGRDTKNKTYISYKFGLLKDMEKRLQSMECDAPVEIRLRQGKETKDFVQLFGGQMVIHRIPHASNRFSTPSKQSTVSFAPTVSISPPSTLSSPSTPSIIVSQEDDDSPTILVTPDSSDSIPSLTVTSSPPPFSPNRNRGSSVPSLSLSGVPPSSPLSHASNVGVNSSPLPPVLQRGEVTMYHVREIANEQTYATELDRDSINASSLCSGDSFVVVVFPAPLKNLNLNQKNGNLNSVIYVWYGKGTSEEEKDLAYGVGQMFVEKIGMTKIVELDEGEEVDDFWEVLGGKVPYASNEYLQTVNRPTISRLFHCSEASGVFMAEEVPRFTQDDLTDDDVFILDAVYEIYMWEGPAASALEKNMGMKTAVEYLRLMPNQGRPENVNITRVIAGNESLLFRCNFLAWRTYKARVFNDPLAQKNKKGNKAAKLKQQRRTSNIMAISPRRSSRKRESTIFSRQSLAKAITRDTMLDLLEEERKRYEREKSEGLLAPISPLNPAYNARASRFGSNGSRLSVSLDFGDTGLGGRGSRLSVSIANINTASRVPPPPQNKAAMRREAMRSGNNFLVNHLQNMRTQYDSESESEEDSDDDDGTVKRKGPIVMPTVAAQTFSGYSNFVPRSDHTEGYENEFPSTEDDISTGIETDQSALGDNNSEVSEGGELQNATGSQEEEEEEEEEEVSDDDEVSSLTAVIQEAMQEYSSSDSRSSSPSTPSSSFTNLSPHVIAIVQSQETQELIEQERLRNLDHQVGAIVHEIAEDLGWESKTDSDTNDDTTETLTVSDSEDTASMDEDDEENDGAKSDIGENVEKTDKGVEGEKVQPVESVEVSNKPETENIVEQKVEEKIEVVEITQNNNDASQNEKVESESGVTPANEIHTENEQKEVETEKVDVVIENAEAEAKQVETEDVKLEKENEQEQPVTQEVDVELTTQNETTQNQESARLQIVEIEAPKEATLPQQTEEEQPVRTVDKVEKEETQKLKEQEKPLQSTTPPETSNKEEPAPEIDQKSIELLFQTKRLPIRSASISQKAHIAAATAASSNNSNNNSNNNNSNAFVLPTLHATPPLEVQPVKRSPAKLSKENSVLGKVREMELLIKKFEEEKKKQMLMSSIRKTGGFSKGDSIKAQVTKVLILEKEKEKEREAKKRNSITISKSPSEPTSTTKSNPNNDNNNDNNNNNNTSHDKPLTSSSSDNKLGIYPVSPKR